MRISAVPVVMIAIAGLMPAALLAQEVQQAPDQHDSTLSEAGKIAARPVHDVGIDNKKVPPVLARAQQAPYSMQGAGNCAQIGASLRALNAVLGPDFGTATAVSGNSAGKIAKVAGEAVVDSVIPFRGLVREVSGAAAAQRKMQAATYAGLARRGFLRGLARAKGCRI